MGIQVSDAAGNLTGAEHWLIGLDGYTTGYPNNDVCDDGDLRRQLEPGTRNRSA